MDSLCNSRFRTIKEFDALFEEEFYLRLKLEDELILISLANTLKKYVLTPSGLSGTVICLPDR